MGAPRGGEHRHARPGAGGGGARDVFGARDLAVGVPTVTEEREKRDGGTLVKDAWAGRRAVPGATASPQARERRVGT